MVPLVMAWIALIFGASAFAGYLVVLAGGRPILEEHPPERALPVQVRLRTMLPMSFALLIACKGARGLDLGAGSILGDALTVGSVSALIGMVVGLLGRLWLLRSAHRAVPATRPAEQPS